MEKIKLGTVDFQVCAPLFPHAKSGYRRLCISRRICFARGVPTRFTFAAALDFHPIWSGDGSHIVFTSNRKGSYNVYWKLSNGVGAEELLLESDQNKMPNDWSYDGHFLLFRSIDPHTGDDLWVLPISGDKKPFPFLKTRFEERNGQFSPDRKWIAYQSNESGRFEITSSRSRDRAGS